MRMSQSITRSAPWLLGLVLFSVAFVFSVGGASTRIMQSFHGLHHSAYVYQIALGIIPPTNPSSIEMPANFYWMWHAWLAAGVRVLGVTPFEMSLVSNALGLSGFLCALWLAAGDYTRNPWLRVAACGIPFFILNPLGLAQFGLRLALVWIPELFRAEAWSDSGLFDHLASIARHHASLGMRDHGLAQLFPRLGIFDGPLLSDRAGHLINKFLNFNSFPLALALFATAQWLLLSARTRPAVRALGLGIACFGMALVSPLPAVAFGISVLAFIGVEGPPLRVARRASSAAAAREQLWSFVAPIAGSGLGVLLALPLLLPVVSAYGGEAVLLTPATGLWPHAVSLGWPLVPTACLLLAAACVRSRLPPSARIHALSAFAYGIAALAVVAPVADPNEYKFVLLTAFPSSLLLLALGRVFAEASGQARASNGRSRARRLACGANLLLGAAGALSICVMALLYVASPWAATETFVYQGATTLLRPNDDPKTRDLAAAYDWLRTSTPTSAHVFETPVSKDDSRLSAVAQRRVVAQLASPFTRAIPHHERLLAANRALLRRIAACETDAASGSWLDGLRDVPVHWPENLYALVERGVGARACRPARAAGVELMFSNALYSIYRLEF